MSGIYLPYQKPLRWNIDRATVAHSCAQLGLFTPKITMPFWENGGNKVYDYSGNQNNGIFQNDPAWVINGIELDGGDDYITCGTSDLDISNELTIIVTAKWDYAGDNEFLIGKIDNWGSANDHWVIYSNSPGRLTFGSTGDSEYADNIYTAGEKGQIAVTWKSGGTQYYYWNGKQKDSNTAQVLGTKLDATLKIGKWHDNSAYFTGTVYDVTIFNRVLAPAQIQTFYNNSYGMLEQVRRPAIWSIPAVGVAPTSIFYGPLVGPLGGPI